MSFLKRDLVPWLVALVITFFILWAAFAFVDSLQIDKSLKIIWKLIWAYHVPKLVVLILKRYAKMNFKQLSI